MRNKVKNALVEINTYLLLDTVAQEEQHKVLLKCKRNPKILALY